MAYISSNTLLTDALVNPPIMLDEYMTPFTFAALSAPDTYVAIQAVLFQYASKRTSGFVMDSVSVFNVPAMFVAI